MRRLLVTLLLLFALPGSAAAGTFDVYTTGCPSGWKAQTFAPGKLQQEDKCSSWRIWSAAPLEQGDFAAMSMYSGDGAEFTGFSVKSAGFTNNGVTWTMGMCKEPFGHCTNHPDRSGAMSELETWLGNAYPGAGPLYATHIYAGVRCLQATCADSSASRAADVTHTSAHAIVDDFTPPGVPTLSGIPTGWVSGTRQLGYSASDAGSGIASAELTVDEGPHASTNHACLRVPTGGYSHPVPCPTATDGQLALDSRRLSEGRHSLTLTVRDAGGEPASVTREFLVDNTAPEPPGGMAVDGGSWARNNSFGISWENPASSGGSPIAGVYYKIGDAPAGPADGTFVAGADINSLSSIPVPGDGDWPVHIWLQDEAGNADHAHAAVARLRLDTAAPSVAFDPARRASSPAEVRVAAADALSGVPGGLVGIRRKGGTEWRALDTRLEDGALVAAVPDDRLPRGTYELQATAWDAAGNSATTTARADGRPMVLALPLRARTRLSATLSRAAGGTGRASHSIRIGYGSSAWVRGSLRSASGRALKHAALLVVSRPLAGGRGRRKATIVTDAQGRYAVRLPRGGSREVTVQFAGNRRLRPATRRARLLVRGWASLELRPPSLRRGGTIAFVGRVGRLGAKLPPAGKLIQIQFLDGRRWRPAVKLAHTRRNGTFAIRYRFRRISRPTRIYFRILVPAEGGWPYATGWSPVRVAFVRP